MTTQLTKLSPLFSTHAGREKLVRFLQYFFMFWIPTLERRKRKLIETSGQAHNEQMETLIRKMGIIKGSMGMTRKVMRFGAQIPMLVNIIRRLRSHKQNPVKMLFAQTMADVFGMLYFLFDHPLYFTNTGFIKSWSEEDKKRCGWWSEFWWLL